MAPVTIPSVAHSDRKTDIVSARQIMGTNFHGDEDIVRFLHTTPTTLHTSGVPFLRATLEECKQTHILVLGAALSIMDIRRLVPRTLFRRQSWPDTLEWYETHLFAQAKVDPRWYLLRKDVLPGSTYCTLDTQIRTLGPRDEIPLASEVVYAAILHYLATGERLLSRLTARTASFDDQGLPVDVGEFDHSGLVISSYAGTLRDGSVGLAVKRKDDVAS